MTSAPVITPAPPPTYNWPRFWIPQGEILDLSDAGFLRNPVDSLFGPGQLKMLSDLESRPALALLGEPGIGKSTTLKREYERVSALATVHNVMSAYVDLNFSSTEDSLYRRIFEMPEVEAWKAGDRGLCLFLDGLDEAMLRIETAPHILAEGISSLPVDRLSVRIACRTAVWPAATLGRALVNTLGERGFGVFELAPLRRMDVVTALDANGIDPEDFIPKLFGAQAVPFAIKPLTLKMLIQIYKRDGRLPTSTGDLYRQGCLALCEETNESRRETGRRGHLNGRQRLRVAGRIAVATVLGNRFAIWTGPESEVPPEDVAVSAISGALENGQFPTFTTTDNDVSEVLNTGLFSARGERGLGWAHQTYGEFLAANYLVEKGVPPNTILKALTHPSGGLIPPLAVTGAWAASLSPDIRASLVTTDPWTLLQGDLSKWPATDLAALVDSLLLYVEGGRFHEHVIGIAETYERLNHPGLPEQLRSIINDRTRKSVTRRRALAISERCGVKVLQPELLRCALDRTEPPMVRAGAVAALKQCGDASIPPQILEMIQGGLDCDADGDIRGHALDFLWPGHISAEQLFSLLSPSTDHYVGSYAHFLFELPGKLGPDDLRPALIWATAYIKSSGIMGEFREKTLADGIMFKAWEAFENPTLTDLFVEHIAVRLCYHGDLCRGTNYKATDAFVERLRTDVARRREFVLRLCQQPTDHLTAASYVRAGFVTSQDFEWLVGISPGGVAPLPGLNEECLCSFISCIFDRGNEDHFETLYPACKMWPLLRKHFAFLVDGVSIDSEDAIQERAMHRYSQEARKRKPQPVFADIPGEIEAHLIAAERGEWRAWWTLTLILMLTPESRVLVDRLEYVITAMPGWLSADEPTRRRIVATAQTYLIDAESSLALWFGKNPMQICSNDLAAVRAFILLRQESPVYYAAIPRATWERWAAVIVGLRLQVNDDSTGETRQLLRDTLSNAPAAFVLAVVTKILMEKEQAHAASGAEAMAFMHPFLWLRDLEGLWDNEDLKAGLFNEMVKPDLTSVQYAALLDVLLKAGYEPAIERAVISIDVLDESTAVIADVLLHRAPGAVWPMLWPKLLANEDLARAVLTRAANRFYHSAGFYDALGPMAVADLYLLMVSLFPPDQDIGPPSGLVQPLHMISSFRDDAVRWLAGRGTDEAVRALMRLTAERPDIPLLPFELSRGELARRLKAWSPLTVREVFALTDRPDARLVTSSADLMENLIETLNKFVTELHGAQAPLRGLWDRQGLTELYRPIDENGFSDVIARYLRQHLSSAGIFANREVEVARHPGAPVGTRTDILINTIRRTEAGDPIDPIAAVIEVKGCWNADLTTAIETQLIQDYMVRLQAPVGIYLVGWFDQAKWDPADGRLARGRKFTVGDIKEKLEGQASAAPEGFQVRAVVMEIASP